MNAWIGWQRYLKVQFQDQHRPFWACAAVRMAALISSPLTPYSFSLLILAIARVQYPNQRKKKNHNQKNQTTVPPAPRQLSHSKTIRTNFSFRNRFEFDVPVQFCSQYCRCKGRRERYGVADEQQLWVLPGQLEPIVELLPKMLWSQQNPEENSMS